MKPPNSGHFGDSHYVRSREVVPFSEVACEATPTDSAHGGVVYRQLHARGARSSWTMDEAAKRALVDKETYTRWHYSAMGRILVKSAIIWAWLSAFRGDFV